MYVYWKKNCYKNIHALFKNKLLYMHPYEAVEKIIDPRE